MTKLLRFRAVGRSARPTGITRARRTLLLPLLISLLAFASESTARDLRVGIDPDVPSIAHAIKLAQPGDVIHLEPDRVYQDYAGFYGKQGAPGKPIILDGHGATLEGSEPLDPAAWREVIPGHYRCEKLLPSMNGAMLARWFFLFDGRIQRMGRVSKGRSAPLKSSADLSPGEWTFEQTSPSTNDHATSIEGVFHLRIAPGQTLAQANIRFPMRSAGVQFSGENAHLVIRNLTVTGRAQGGECHVMLEQVHLRRLVEPRQGKVATRGKLAARQTTFEDMTLDVTDAADLQNCLLNGQPTSTGATGADLADLSRLQPSKD